ncbi:hypothetical protein BBB39_02925 [Bordetella trematum]|nr:hypothetical protein BBB39_02925 [Bordetella trematum]
MVFCGVRGMDIPTETRRYETVEREWAERERALGGAMPKEHDGGCGQEHAGIIPGAGRQFVPPRDIQIKPEACCCIARRLQSLPRLAQGRAALTVPTQAPKPMRG